MKRGTIDHPKTLRLARLLVLPRWGAVGILESMWHFTARHAIRGDIGRWSDEEIAEGVGWADDAGRLVSALESAGWIDAHPTCRYVVHDWHEHCDDSVRKTLKNRRETFASIPESFPPEAAVSEPFRNFPETEATVPENSGNGSPKPEPSHSHSHSLARAEPSRVCARAHARRLDWAAVPKPPGFDTPEVEAAFGRWYAHLSDQWEARHEKPPPVDLEANAAEAMRMFASPEVLVRSVSTAITNGWITLRNTEPAAAPQRGPKPRRPVPDF